MNTRLCQLLKNEIRACIALSKSFRVNGDRRAACQFLNDAAESRRELMELMRG